MDFATVHAMRIEHAGILRDEPDDGAANLGDLYSLYKLPSLEAATDRVAKDQAEAAARRAVIMAAAPPERRRYDSSITDRAIKARAVRILTLLQSLPTDSLGLLACEIGVQLDMRAWQVKGGLVWLRSRKMLKQWRPNGYTGWRWRAAGDAATSAAC